MNGWQPSTDSITTSNGFGDSGRLDAGMFNANAFTNQRVNTPQYPYAVNSVIPSKRPRPDDGVQASPRQPPVNLNLSRSQTPQQGYPGGGFQGSQQPGQPMQAPTPFQHLQNAGSGNATPSPTLQNQQFLPPQAQAQRMQTVSPNPAFPQQAQGMSMSPPPDPNARVTTPQNPQFNLGAQMAGQPGAQMGGMNFMPGMSQPQQFSQSFGANPNMAAAGMAGGFAAPQVNLPPNLAQQQAQTQRLYQLKQQQQMMMNNMAAAQQRQQAGTMNPAMMAAAAAQQGMGTPTRPQGTSVQQQQQLIQNQAFVRKVQSFMQQLGRPFNPSPTVCGRPIMLWALFSLVNRAQGSKRVTMENKWSLVARSLGYPEEQFPSAGAEVRHVFEQCLGSWEAAALNQQMPQAREKMQAMQAAQMAGMTGQQMSPSRAMPQTPQGANQAQQQQHYMQNMQQLQQRMQQQQQAMGPMTPAQNPAALAQANGWSTPQPDLLKQQQMEKHQKSASRQVEGSPAHTRPGFPGPSPAPEVKPPDRPDSETKMQPNGVVDSRSVQEHPSTNYQPNMHRLERYWGPMDNNIPGQHIAALVPNVPELPEMGNIDLRALSLSLQSGIQGEVRYALDILAKLTVWAPLVIDLEQCEDLLDIIIDCGEEQVDILAGEAAEVSDAIDPMSYEDVFRNVKLELVGLRDVPEVGSREYDLDRAVERLLAITTILRNFSFQDKNGHLLSKPQTIKFISNTIRLLGTRNILLRTYDNTQDFMKDIVVILSNLSDKIILSSREDASSIIHFLLSFAPSPSPASSERLRIPPFNPRVHRYFPLALDALAKILIREDPNRNYFKQLFYDISSSSSTAPVHQRYALLTRAFAMAVAVVPDRLAARQIIPAKPEEAIVRISEARKPTLTQGMLAADIIAGLIPPNEPSLANAWVNAEDGWAPSLFRLVCSLLSQSPGPRGQQLGPNGVPIRRPPGSYDDHGFGLICHRALAMLKKVELKASECLPLRSKWRAKPPLLNGDADEEQDGASGEALDKQTDGTIDESDGQQPKALTDVEKDEGADSDAESFLDEDFEHAKFWACVAGEVLPRADTILGALMSPQVDQEILRDMHALLNLGGGL